MHAALSLNDASLPSSRLLTGRPASPGFSMGRIVTLSQDAGQTRLKGSSEGEAAALAEAIRQALDALAGLAGAMEGEAAEMLAFQIAMLEDDALTASAYEGIAQGQSAEDAFRACLDAEIAGYESSGDEYFRARSSDLFDIRDRVLAALSGSEGTHLPEGALLLADDITPSRFLSTQWSGGAILLRKGSPTSHVAMLARARVVPMIVGLVGSLNDGEEVLVDATSGQVVVAPDPEARARFAGLTAARYAEAELVERYRMQPAVTADGTPVKVLLNIADMNELTGLDPSICDGIGLVRTELLFEGAALPDEETQYKAYRDIALWAKGRPVTVRTLDAGGDKPIAGVTMEGESNPFLGVRGVRLTLRRPEIFRTQLAALCRAAVHGDVEIMVPMVSVPEELEHTRALLDDVIRELETRVEPYCRPRLGIMVEVPSVAIMPERFAADFFSIGSNDLTQYVMAAGRDIEGVADLARADDPAVLRLIASVAAHGVATGKKVSLCGDAGGDPHIIPALLKAGLRILSMSPRLVARAKACIAMHSLDPS